MQKHDARTGFSLVEIAIVILVIALLLGVIAVGETMIRSAKINNTIIDLSRYTQAMTDFRDKYIALPGDLATAESYWGSDAGCPTTAYTATPHRETCNGDGNGLIDGSTEPLRLWQQLADAGFISGSYTGVAGPGGGMDHVAGVNAPATALPQGGFDMFYMGKMSGDVHYFDGNYQVKIGIGRPSVGTAFDNPIFTPGEAFLIDSKMDDGVPGTGNIMPFKSSINPGCSTTDVSTTSKYAVDSSQQLCSLNIIIPDTVK